MKVYLEISRRLTFASAIDWPGWCRAGFGAPGVIPDGDRESGSDAELDRQIHILKASWRAFDSAADAARGRGLAAAGPRGGGRALGQIRDHVRGADGSYARAVGATISGGANVEWNAVQGAFIDALHARAHAELPDRGPRGGARWPAPYAIRRSAWHALDHAWEVQDRAGT